jgi:predicted nucleic acid-binding protein
VRTLVLDASVVLKWFSPSVEPGSRQARALRDEYRAGRLEVVVPSLLWLEILNVAGRRWGFDEPSLLELAGALSDLGFVLTDPAPDLVAAWVARGLTAYDAAYVAVAEERGVPLVSDDRTVLGVAGDVAQPLA